MDYRVRHDFAGGGDTLYRRGEIYTDPDWPNLHSLAEAGYIEALPVRVSEHEVSPQTDIGAVGDALEPSTLGTRGSKRRR